MNVSVPQELAAVGSLDQLYPWLNSRSMMALWHKPTASLYREPKKNFLPMHWRWREGKAALDRAGGLISAELAHRRNLLLYNQADANGYAAVRTMVGAYQMILPGETAPSHRHSGNALRVILEGEGAYTIVEGERLDMKTNDVILTPHWTWHGHGSDADEPCYWLDALDTPPGASARADVPGEPSRRPAKGDGPSRELTVYLCLGPDAGKPGQSRPRSRRSFRSADRTRRSRLPDHGDLYAAP